MKSSAPNSTKFKCLKRRLNLNHMECVGLLESLWLMAANDAIQGDIGKFSNEVIAAMIEYPGNEDELISALVSTGWLDESPEHRLVIHDWHEHAPNYVKANVKKHKNGVWATAPCARTRNAGVRAHGANEDTPIGGSPEDAPRGRSPGDAPTKPSLAQPSLAQSNQAKPKAPKAIEQVMLGGLFSTSRGHQLLQEWIAYKSERGDTYKKRGLQVFVNRHQDWTAERFHAAMEHSMSQNYKGLFEAGPSAASNQQELDNWVSQQEVVTTTAEPIEKPRLEHTSDEPRDLPY